MRGVAQQLWRSGPSWLDWGQLEQNGVRRPSPGRPIKHYSKALAKMIFWQRDYLLWRGHDPDNADGITRGQIRAAIRMLMADRWGCTVERQRALDKGRFALERVLARSPAGDVWDADRQAFLVDHHRAALLDGVERDHPCVTNYLSRAAEQLREHHEEHQRDGAKLEREIAEGDLPLHERLTKMVYEWRRQRFLPRTPPTISDRITEQQAMGVSLRLP